MFPTPTSANSETVSRIVTSCDGFASLVDSAAAKPANPAPITKTRSGILFSAVSGLMIGIG